MTVQSSTQQALQNLTGVQTNAQPAATVGAVNNGSPNTTYNIPPQGDAWGNWWQPAAQPMNPLVAQILSATFGNGSGVPSGNSWTPTPTPTPGTGGGGTGGGILGPGTPRDFPGMGADGLIPGVNQRIIDGTLAGSQRFDRSEMFTPGAVLAQMNELGTSLSPGGWGTDPYGSGQSIGGSFYTPPSAMASPTMGNIPLPQPEYDSLGNPVTSGTTSSSVQPTTQNQLSWWKNALEQIIPGQQYNPDTGTSNGAGNWIKGIADMLIGIPGVTLFSDDSNQ